MPAGLVLICLTICHAIRGSKVRYPVTTSGFAISRQSHAKWLNSVPRLDAFHQQIVLKMPASSRIENPRVTGSIPVLGTIQSLKHFYLNVMYPLLSLEVRLRERSRLLRLIIMQEADIDPQGRKRFQLAADLTCLG